MTVLVLTDPCTKTVPHSPHPIVVMSPYAPTLVTTLSCPGWTFPVAPTSSTSPPPRPAPILPDPIAHPGEPS